MSSLAIALSYAVEADLSGNHCEVDIRLARTSREAACISLRHSLLKKFDGHKGGNADAAAWEKFVSANYRCANWKHDPSSTLDELLLGEFKQAVYNFFTVQGYDLDLSPFECLQYARVGPGASLQASGTTCYNKLFASRLTVTDPLLYNMYRAFHVQNQHMITAESHRAAVLGEYVIVDGSKVTFVPKNVDISRLICTEPSLNMFYQLGAEYILRTRLKQCFGIDLETAPDRARHMARLGSITGGYSTIDLRSASDSLSTGLMRWALPSSVFRWLDLYRVKHTSSEFGSVALDMFSTMGNGFTFPLQTIIFSCVVAAAYRTLGLSRPNAGHGANFCVFGDDIIIDAKANHRVLRLLELIGCTVNSDKTFTEGPFRESCGHDYFRGINVRGVYIKRLTTLQDLFVAYNQLQDWSNRHVYLGRALATMLGAIYQTMYPLDKRNRSLEYIRRRLERIAVPVWEQHDAGLHSLIPPANVRYDKNQSFVYTAYRPRPMRHAVMHAVLNEAGRRYVASEEVFAPNGALINPHGLWQAFLLGEIRNGFMTLRPKATLPYRTRRVVTPSWEYAPPGISGLYS